MTNKSLVTKFFNFINNSGGAKNGNISARKAAAMQQKFIADEEEDVQSREEPLFDEIALQLDSPKEEIFDAALYYLNKIALNNSQYAATIAEILDDCLLKNKKNSLRKAKINQVLNSFKLK